MRAPPSGSAPRSGSEGAGGGPDRARWAGSKLATTSPWASRTTAAERGSAACAACRTFTSTGSRGAVVSSSPIARWRRSRCSPGAPSCSGSPAPTRPQGGRHEPADPQAYERDDVVLGRDAELQVGLGEEEVEAQDRGQGGRDAGPAPPQLRGHDDDDQEGKGEVGGVGDTAEGHEPHAQDERRQGARAHVEEPLRVVASRVSSSRSWRSPRGARRQPTTGEPRSAGRGRG